MVSAVWRSQANVEKTNGSTWDQRCRKSYQAGAPRSRNEASVLIERAGSCTRAQALEQVQETQEEHVQVLNVFADALDAVHAHESLEERLEEHREGIEDRRVL